MTKSSKCSAPLSVLPTIIPGSYSLLLTTTTTTTDNGTVLRGVIGIQWAGDRERLAEYKGNRFRIMIGNKSLAGSR